MPFGIVGWTGPLMWQVVGFGDRSTGRGRPTFEGLIWGAPLSTGTYRAYVCYSAATRPSCQIALGILVIIIIISGMIKAYTRCCVIVDDGKYFVSPVHRNGLRRR